MTSKTRFIRVKLFDDSGTIGNVDTYKTDLDVQVGDTVVTHEGHRGLIIGFATMSMVINRDAVKEIVGIVKEDA